MAIPASQIVSISPRVLQAGGTDLVLNGLFLTDNALIPTGVMAVKFATADDVAGYFGDDSDEYEAASVYFRGYNNSFSKPSSILFGRRIHSDVSGYLRGGEVIADISQFKLMTNARFNITVDGSQVSATGIDLSNVTSYSDVAYAVQQKMSVDTAVTVEYSSLTKAFTITSNSTGNSSSVSFAEEPGTTEEGVTSGLATMMKIGEFDGGVKSAGMNQATVSDNMRAIRNVSENWATFTTLYESETQAATRAEFVELAKWAGNQGVDYLFVCHSEDANLKNQSSTSHVAADFDDANVGATTLVYGDHRYAAFVMGVAASIDWNRTQGTITFAFKAQDGLESLVDNATEASILLGRKVNIYGEYATRNDQFVWLYDGSMFGDYKFIDPFINAVWLNNAIQVAIMTGLKQSPRVPYNEDGYSLIRAWVQDPINRAIRNGTIDHGVSLSEAQKAEVIREAGLDITKDLETVGYYLQVEDAGAQVRVTRDSPTLNLFYTYGGSCHKISLASTLLA